MEKAQDQYEKPLAIDLSAILPIYGTYCMSQSGAYNSDPDSDE
jgi:hypothetical protein